MSGASREPVKAILLDALGTLLELVPPAPVLRAELAGRFGVELDETEARRAIAAEIAFYRAHLDEGCDQATLDELRRRCAEVLRAAMPEGARERLPPAHALVDALLASLRFQLYPEVRPALRSWRARGLRLVAVSNWDVSLHAVLERLELGPMLDGVITSAEAGVRKPSPAIFEQALQLAGVRAARALHVGDSLDEDIAGARAAGIEPVWVNRGDAPPPAEVRTIRSLAQLQV